MQYLFGNNNLAAQRLKVLAEVFAEQTRSFLLYAVPRKLHTVLDLGCGPGYSTHFLACVLECENAVGLDNSEYFISLAQKTRTERVSFCLHDVTSVPFPIGESDLFYCRFLLTHLQEPLEVVMKWATQLQPKGFILLEELEWIQTNNTVFNIYLKIVEAMLENATSKLYVGSVLDTMKDSNILKKHTNHVRCLEVTNRNAAIMFFLNMQSWKNRPFIQKNYSAKIISQLKGDLHALTKESSSKREIEWGVRQIAFERL